MRLKSYFAESVEAAVAQAARELGAEAMLVQSRRISARGATPAEYEVIFAVEGGEPARAPGPPQAITPGFDALIRDVGDLRRQLERTTAAIARAATWARLSSARSDVARLYSSLLEQEVDPDLAQEIAAALEARPASSGVEEIAGRIRTDPGIGSITAVCGPPGAGKTTALVKIAARYTRESRKPVQIISLDNYRIAAWEPLRIYASVLGAGFEFLDTVGHLDHSLREHRHKGLILVDTPGYGPHDLDAAGELAYFLGARQDIDTHLVLTASMKSADLNAAVDRFEMFQPRKLLFTRLDETATFGALLNQAMRSGKPISFLSSGQRVPEDLEPAAPDLIAGLICGPAGALRGRNEAAA